jgi:pimeloyl-ACP methyl ester carboxylesterase
MRPNPSNQKEPIVKAPRHVVFSHGLESGPWGTKISALAPIARAEGYEVDSVDYTDLRSPAERVTRLVDACNAKKGELVLVGSSLGGYVSVAAAGALHARAVFLMAPAFYRPELPELRERILDCPTCVVHGWRDDVIPVDSSIRFAREHRAELHVLDGDHGLRAQLPTLIALFEYFLISIELLPERRKR